MPQGIQINLMNAHAHEVKQQKLFFARIQFYAAGILVIYLAVLLLIIGYRGLTYLNLQRMKEKIQQETLSIAQLAAVETKYTLLHNKLTLVRSFWNQQVDVKKILGDIALIMVDSVKVENISYESGTKAVEIKVTARDVLVLSQWLNMLEESVSRKDYKKIDVASLGRSKDGTYSTTITIYINHEST